MPLCPSFAFGSFKRKVWRTKPVYGSIRKTYHIIPCKLVCVDQMIRSQLRLVPQSSAYFTASIIWTCNIFLEVCSNYGYSFTMRYKTLDQTLQAKRSSERELTKHNVQVVACRTGNGRFADLGFKEEVRNCNQIM